MYSLASLSHFSFSTCPSCPLIHSHFISCIFESLISLSQRALFFTGSFWELIHPFFCQPEIHSFIPFTRYWESLTIVIFERCFIFSMALMAAVSSILLFVVDGLPPLNSADLPSFLI